MDAETVVLVFGPIMPLIIGLLKNIFPKSNPRFLSGVFCATIAITFGVSTLIFNEVLIEAFIQKLIVVTTLVYAIGTGLYKLGK